MEISSSSKAFYSSAAMEERYRTALLTTARQEIGTGIQGNVVSGMATYPAPSRNQMDCLAALFRF
jgi:hypothetical protein